MASGNDRAPLAALFAYQQEVVARYAAAADPKLERLRAEAEDAARVLRRALVATGGKPSPSPRSDEGSLRAIIEAEEALVAGYYSAMQSFAEARHMSGAAALMAQAGRRLVALRDLAGGPLLPRAFETGGA